MPSFLMRFQSGENMKKILYLFMAIVFSITINSACSNVSAQIPGFPVADQVSVTAAVAVYVAPDRQTFAKENTEIKSTALSADVQTDAGIRLKNSVRSTNFERRRFSVPPSKSDVLPTFEDTLNYDNAPDRFSGFGTDCSARAKI